MTTFNYIIYHNNLLFIKAQNSMHKVVKSRLSESEAEAEGKTNHNAHSHAL